MSDLIRILLQTTIPAIEDDWNIDRFSLLAEHMSSITDEKGQSMCQVTARNRESSPGGSDKVLSKLDQTDFDELWLFAVDRGNGLTVEDCEGITRFRQRGGGIFTTRDHQDLGSSLCTLGGVGRAHYFHSRHLDPDDSRRTRDDRDTPIISWPNYHSGSNGDYQVLTPVGPVHEVLRGNNSDVIRHFPAHPHEGGIGAPQDDQHARVIATGVSKTTNRPFNLIVAFEKTIDRHGNTLGRAIADSSFHHLVDYNWDISKGCPSFLAEPPGDQILKEPEKLNDVKTFVTNVVRWLA
jgi:hypothetical protein